MGARQENLRPALLAADVVDVGADAVAVAEGLTRDELVAAHDALAAAEIDDDVAVLDALDLAIDDLADAVLELLVLAVALRVAHLLDDDLLGGLRRDAAEVHGAGSGSAMKSPGCAAGLRARASSMRMSVAGFSIFSTTLSRRCSLISPVFGLISARMSVSEP